MFLVLPGLFFLIISVYANVWGLIHLGEAYGQCIAARGSCTLTQALGLAFSDYPYTYVIGLLTLVIGLRYSNYTSGSGSHTPAKQASLGLSSLHV